MNINEKEICFIICNNNQQYTQQCISHISQVAIPDGYSIDLLTVEEASSMTGGYNEGMNASNARYKIYLHQDVFILNKNIIFDILNIFKDPEIGMIGVMGSRKLPQTGVMWYGMRVGMLYSNQITGSVSSLFQDFSEDYCTVEAIDGLIMITQYDIPWRDDLFHNWDFYDISQSFEFRRSGYKVVVPHCQEPWCFHDCPMMNLTNYFKEREIFIKEYLS